MNETLKKVGKQILKDLLSQCNEEQQLLFKRMYSHHNLELPINEVVDKIDESKIEHAISQSKRTALKNLDNMSDIEKEKNGFFDLPKSDRCTDPSHEPPMYLYIPPGKGYKHVCPKCGNVQYVIPTQIYL